MLSKLSKETTSFVNNQRKKVDAHIRDIKRSIKYSDKSTLITGLQAIGWILAAIILVSAVVGVVGLVLLWPIWVCWAINHLFGTAIPLTFWTWLAVMIVAWFIKMVLRVNVVYKIN